MELEEIAAVLEKIWDLHDKISDAIHAISRSHFLDSIKAQKKSDDVFFSCTFDKRKPRNDSVDDRSGFVFVKDINVDNDSALAEAKSFNSIRTALENLEDQLEFFHTIQSQQQTERDAAIARLEQSRIILAMRLADHQGQKCKVIEEVLAFVGDVENAGCFINPENLFQPPKSQSGENLGGHVGKRPNIVMQVLASGFTFAKKSLKLERMGGILGNAALFTVSILAFLHVHQVAFQNNIMVEVPEMRENSFYSKGKENSPALSGRVKHLDVLSARG
ncbi:plastid division protein PDV1-like [Telopea speciosissima]|uniref:plastid division protein PDV1-like n=1 Tax=Telopea speciosissima TaxID=54955 RepID=UPI001CC7388C|nr:plastid division protein PDV1-like [Telopea speciosissima]